MLQLTDVFVRIFILCLEYLVLFCVCLVGCVEVMVVSTRDSQPLVKLLIDEEETR